MELVPLQQADFGPADETYGESTVRGLVVFLAMLALAVGMACWHIFGDMPLLMACFSGGGAILVGIIPLRMFKKSRSPDNWILVITGSSVMIKFRSYLNSNFPAGDRQVVVIPFSEIESVGTTKEKRETMDASGVLMTSYVTTMDIKVASDLSDLKECLTHERELKASTRYHHYPVAVDDDRIRIDWRGPKDRIVPNIRRAIDSLARKHVRIVNGVNGVTERALPDAESDEEQKEAEILDQIQQGNMIGAVTLARKTYGLSLAEAKQFVDDTVKR